MPVTHSIQSPEQAAGVEVTKTPKCTTAKTKAFLIKWHLPGGLAFGLFFGYLVPVIGVGYDSILGNVDWISMSNVHVFLIFLMSGMKLKTDDITKAIHQWKAIIYGVLAILFITPLLGILVMNIPFDIIELQSGLVIFCNMPTTLSSGVILTGFANGNTALALLLTVVTNLMGIFTIPPMLAFVFGSGDGITVDIDAGNLIFKLCLFILLPLVVGKVLRQCVPAIGSFTSDHKLGMKLASSLLLIMIPWMSVSKSVDTMRLLTFREVAACFGLGFAIHLVYLSLNLPIAQYLLKLELPEKKALVLVSSQKTLPVALTIIDFLPDGFGSKGLLAVPCIIAHFCQILSDGFIAARWVHDTDGNDDDNGATDDYDAIGPSAHKDATDVELNTVISASQR